MNTAPLGYLTSAGDGAGTILPLTWFTLIISIAVSVIVAVLLWLAIRRGQPNGTVEAREVPVQQRGDALGWIRWGMALSLPPLLITVVWTMIVLGRIVGAPTQGPTVIDITPHQFWWSVEYSGASGSDIVTANEIHMPTGERMLVRLHGGDVIHSFWVPQLSGKTDAIPGQTNTTWLKTDRPGRYRGQCAEYCGAEHAKMAFEVVAESPAAFAAWFEGQRRAATAPASPGEVRGQQVYLERCATCHALRGTPANGTRGPDLSHLMTRTTLAAGVLPNTRGSLAGWIQAPQTVKPGALMPDQQLTGQQLNDVLDYLEAQR